MCNAPQRDSLRRNKREVARAPDENLIFIPRLAALEGNLSPLWALLTRTHIE